MSLDSSETFNSVHWPILMSVSNKTALELLFQYEIYEMQFFKSVFADKVLAVLLAMICRLAHLWRISPSFVHLVIRKKHHSSHWTAQKSNPKVK